MSEAILDSRRIDHAPATVVPSVRAGWTALKAVPARWLSRQRLGGNIAHLDDRLLADVGLGPGDLGLGERLIRRFAAGGDIWRRDRAGR
jgi:uncharacterized protein YjiS (DUF1127 family)